MSDGKTNGKKPGRFARWRRKPVLILALAICAVVVVALLPANKPEPQATPAPPINVLAETIAPLESVADVLEVHGTVQAERVVNVAAEAAGRIERYAAHLDAAGKPDGRALKKGDTVRAGQPLMYINADLLRAERDRAEANWNFDRRELERVQEAHGRGVATSMDLDNARTKLAVSKATLDECGTRLARATIVCPVDGVLNDLPVEVGEYVTNGMTVAQIVSETVKVAVDVPEKDVQYFRVGDEEVVYDGLRGAFTMTGRIGYISKLADTVARTTRMEIHVPDPAHQLHSEQIVSVRLKRRELPGAILIPLEAVIPQVRNDRITHQVYVVENGLAQPRQVRIDVGFIRGTRVLVREGSDLRAGDVLIVRDPRRCGPGQPVRVIAPNGATTRPAAGTATREASHDSL